MYKLVYYVLCLLCNVLDMLKCTALPDFSLLVCCVLCFWLVCGTAVVMLSQLFSHFQEIVEFPVLKVNGRTFETEAIFHQYVQPRVHPQLSPFCTEVCHLFCYGLSCVKGEHFDNC